MKHQLERKKRTPVLFIGCILAVLLVAGVFVNFRPNELFADSHEQVKGIDVSQWQGKVRWDIVKQNGISFGYAKATEGTRNSPYTSVEVTKFPHGWHPSGRAQISFWLTSTEVRDLSEPESF